MRWMTGRSDELDRQVGLGTFERYIFERFDELGSSHINAIELLPVTDSPDSINWGYGTRFFFAPNIDLGGPVDLKLLIKRCHQRGIRVLLDVVMNHSKECPLQQLADGGFIFDQAAPKRETGMTGVADSSATARKRDGRYPAREFHLAVADIRLSSITWKASESTSSKASTTGTSFRNFAPGPGLLIRRHSRADRSSSSPRTPGGAARPPGMSPPTRTVGRLWMPSGAWLPR
jgi:hypothetical protein